MKWYHDLLHTDPNLHNKPLFSVGQKVLVKGTDLRVKVKSPKLAAKNYGPYEIIEQLSPVTFKLKLPKAMKVHPVYHASKFIPYHEDTIAGCKPTEPPPIKVEGYNEFEVEEILDSTIKRKKIQYLVKWKGYDPPYNTWEPLRNLQHCIKLVEDFHQKYPEAPEPVSWTNATPINHLYERHAWFPPLLELQP
jgi:hypothetical protein